jgi:hypothetical protein
MRQQSPLATWEKGGHSFAPTHPTPRWKKERASLHSAPVDERKGAVPRSMLSQIPILYSVFYSLLSSACYYRLAYCKW